MSGSDNGILTFSKISFLVSPCPSANSIYFLSTDEIPVNVFLDIGRIE